VPFPQTTTFVDVVSWLRQDAEKGIAEVKPGVIPTSTEIDQLALAAACTLLALVFHHGEVSRAFWRERFESWRKGRSTNAS
jgi:hypothetical protein